VDASRAVRTSLPIRILILLSVLSMLWPTSVLGAPTLPGSMASTGDSITRAFNTCWFPFTDCVANSWSTGTSTTVQSHYLRIRAANGAINGRNWNHAKSGAKMVDLPGQMTAASGRNPQYVTVQMGGNDVCTSSTTTMTSVEAYTASFTSAMDIITGNPSVTTVYVTSVPDAHRLWELFYTNSTARSTWARYNVCQSLLANPTSLADVDMARRGEVRARNVALNQALEDVCARYVECVWDGWSTFCTSFAASDVSTRDYFHPSVSGQKKLATVSWNAGPFAATPSPYLGADCLP
jgi:lysophospholipase L1-like esterase